MTYTYTYRLTSAPEGFLARCTEMPISALGPTEEAAVAALRQAICEHLGHVEAVAPPSAPPTPSIDLRRAEDKAPEPQGPGDSPAAEHLPDGPSPL